MRRWVSNTLRMTTSPLSAAHGLAERVLLRLNLVLPELEPVDDGPIPSRDELARSYLAYETSVDLLPDVVDAVLHLLPVPLVFVVESSTARKPSAVMSFMDAMTQSRGTWGDDQRKALSGLLDDALSALRVRADGLGLERRSGVS
jgi:hypothetical protein